MSILTINDFEDGRYILAISPDQEADLQIYIDYVENYYLKRMFGVELEVLFQADLIAGVPQTARFIAVFDSFDHQDTNGGFIYSSEGVKEMLKGLAYFYYLRDLNNKVATTGTIKTKSANSENISANWLSVQSRYNEAVDTYKAIQYYMVHVNSSDYPEYEGIQILKTNPF
jgi:hypothetical protein